MAGNNPRGRSLERQAERRENDPEMKEAPYASSERSREEDVETAEAKKPGSRPEPARHNGMDGDVYGR